MYADHRVFSLPTDRSKRIWRYLDIPRYLSLLEKGALFFCRVDRLGDRFEGSLPKTTYHAIQHQLERARADQLATVERIIKDIKAKNETIPSEILRWRASLQDSALHGYVYSQLQREWIGVSCWHMNEIESAAMWSQYASVGKGVAIQSTIRLLIDSLDATTEEVLVGVVNYIDYESDDLRFDNGFQLVLHKRRSFSHEQELRAVVWRGSEGAKALCDGGPPPMPEGGLYVSVDVGRLIESVRVTPGSPDWQLELVGSITKRYGLAVPVTRSELDGEPLF